MIELDHMLRSSPLFGALEPSERQGLIGRMHDVVLQAGQVLFTRGDPGDGIYVVMEGRIRISVLSADGRELAFAHAAVGDVFGEIAALDGAGRSADATAIAPARLKVLASSVFRELLLAKPSVALATISLLCTRLRDVSEHYEAAALHPVDVRLARLLLERLSEGDQSVALDMSQTDLAFLIGTTRQRANAALLNLERAGAIRRAGSEITCNVQALREIGQRN